MKVLSFVRDVRTFEMTPKGNRFGETNMQASGSKVADLEYLRATDLERQTCRLVDQKLQM